MECFYKTKQNASVQCRQAVADAGYDVKINPSAATTQVGLSSTELLGSLQDVGHASDEINASRLRQLVVKGMQDPSRTNRMNRPALYSNLGKLAQLTIAIQFD